MSENGWAFSIVQRVRFSDLDAMQHMNNVEFLRNDPDGRLVAEGWGVLVGYDYATGRAQPLPEPVCERFERDLAADVR